MAPWPALEASCACAQVSAAASQQAIQKGTKRQLRHPREPPALPVRLHVAELRMRLGLTSLAFDHRGQARLARVRVLKDPRVPVRLFDWRAVHIENGVSVAIPNHLGEGQLRRMCADLVEASDEVHRDTTTATLRAIMSAQESAG